MANESKTIHLENFDATGAFKEAYRKEGDDKYIYLVLNDKKGTIIKVPVEDIKEK